MEDPKPSASLSSGLLARKGGARPAMRRPAVVGANGDVATTQDDLGWNDMGYDVNPAPDAPMDKGHDGANPLSAAVPEVKPEVRQQQERIARQLQAQPETDYPKEEIADANKSPSLPVGGVWAAETDEPQDKPVLSKKPVLVEKPVSTPVQAPEPDAPVVAAKPAAVAPVAAVAPKKRAAPGSKGKAAFTLRLDKERHLKLRLACAVNNKSAQMLVTEALDALLDDMPEVGQLAANVPNVK